MSAAKPTLPRLLEIPFDALGLFSKADMISGIHIENMWLNSEELEGTSLSESLLVKIDFSRIDVARFDISDCHLKSCDFTASKLPDSVWTRVLIDAARCSGLQITHGRMRNVAFKSSKLEMVNFRFSYLENIVFEDCVIDDVDFYEARLKNVEFINCTINKINFANARMTSVDVSGSTVERIGGISSLRGVTMSYDQLVQLAPAFAAEFGIKIK